MDLESNYIPPIKLKPVANKNHSHDIYCFACHSEGDVIKCYSCPRVYHLKCLDLIILPSRKWTCPGCEISLSSSNTVSLRYQTEHELHTMLQHAFYQLKSQPQSKAFIHSINEPKYLEYIVHPLSLENIQKNIQLKKYNSTAAFLSDIKWILHNMLHLEHSKVTNNARVLVKNSYHEVTEIHICPECYLRSAQLVAADWFTIPCAIPHTLCWAKMKSYQSWPAKVLRIVNDQVDVRFFGTHNRAWVPISNCFVLSKDYPGSLRRKSDAKFDKSLSELETHVNRLKKLYGDFTYAPPQTLLSKTKPFKFVSIIDDSILPTYMTIPSINSSDKCRRGSLCYSSQKSTELSSNSSQEQSIKRKRIHNDEYSNIQDSALQPRLQIFDIFNLSIDQEPSLSFRPPSPTDNKFQIRALLRRYVNCESPVDDTITTDVKSTMDSLLNTIDASKSSSKVASVKRIRTKKSRKRRRVQSRTRPNLKSSPVLHPLLSPFIPLIPLRRLSVSSPSDDASENIPSTIHKSSTVDESNRRPSIEIIPTSTSIAADHQTSSSVSTNSFFISPPVNARSDLPVIIPNFPSISQNNNTLLTEARRTQAIDLTESGSNPNQLSSDDSCQAKHEMQSILTSFNNQFQEVITTLTAQMQSSLETTRLKYEKDLEELHRSYRQSLNDLHSIATEQIQEIHNTLELQYWTRLSEIHRRYETKLTYH
ncbi:unnamed protein product [Adineta ricciae]|uniref:Protein kinase C-binding protein 1 n=1 Tax=Adineta ricciae TaxID=249248 RepID=A0A814AC89_ADIRI|nr:unnamed protein product [Adineta ricciae]